MSQTVELSDAQKMSVLLTKIHKVKSKMGAVTKGSSNPFFKSKYADLNAHLSLLEPLLDKEGLVLTQSTVAAGIGNIVQSEIHDSTTGARLSSSLKLPDLADMQKLGAAVTYARRFTLSALVGMQAEDDDGNTAVGRKASKPKTTSKGDF